MNGSCYILIALPLVLLAVCITAEEFQAHNRIKRQLPQRPRGFPLSRSRQFPPPEELEESEVEDEEDKNETPSRTPFRGRQPPPPPEEDYSDDYSNTEAPKTTVAPARPTGRTSVLNNRFAGRPRFGASSSTTTAPSRSRSRVTPAENQQVNAVANILNPTSTAAPTRKPADANRRSGNGRVRGRTRLRARTSTTTTTTTTTPAPTESEEYYYYYEDEQDGQPILTTSSTTTSTTTTTKRPAPAYSRKPPLARRPSGRTSRPIVKFDLESQFAPPPDDVVDLPAESGATKKFTTSTTTTPPPGGIPAHLRSKYRDRTDGRFIDFLRDPNRPRELKGFDLTDYPFYIKVPEDITFDCEDMKDGYYASIPHKCQLFHYCFAGARYDFLCANYTLYDQTTFTCRFANNVDCPSSEKYYYRNDDLWKETTTPTPETTTPKKKKITPKEDDYEEYDEEDYYEDEEDEPPRRRRPAKRRRNRRKNKRKEEDE